MVTLDLDIDPDVLADPTESGAADDGNDDKEPEGNGAEAEPKDDNKAEIADLRSKFEQLTQQNAVLLDRLSKQPAPAAAVEPEADEDEDEDDTDPAKLADELTTQGMAALRKRGVLTAKQTKALIRAEAEKIAEKIVDRKASQMSAQSNALAPYAADLNDTKSPFYAKVTEVFNDMVRINPAYRDDPNALALACRTAKAELAVDGKQAQADEAERQKKIARQSGDSGRGSGNASITELTADQKAFARAAGVSEKEFRDSYNQLQGRRGK